MTIRALPASTVRLLGSSVNIPTPPALVKELLDNALDARATSVWVTISANTVDKIQVKDDGDGINMDDFDCLGRRAHTSKLQSFDELKRNEVRTLGFRGEAIAAANSLALITIVTKRTTDPIGTRIRLKPGIGGVEAQSPAAAPLGTTVKAEKLFEAIPVRKQQALKESHKAISKIKNILQAYAMARPHLRLSLKVIGEPKQDWIYAPSANPTVHDAVMKIFGKDLAAGCEIVQAKFTLDHTSSEKKIECATMDAMMPLDTCEPRLLNGKGAFVSVDSRPLSSTIRFGKKVVSIFKSHYACLREMKGLPSKLSCPFVRIDIQCLHASYDFNVAPLKDEVLFEEEQKILDLFEKFCRQRRDSLNTSVEQSTIQKPDELTDQARQPPGLTVQESSPQSPASVVTADETAEVEENTAQFCKMRTAIKVDLGRTISDSTDENVTSDTIPVKLPSKPLMRGKCDFVSSKVKKGANGAPLLRKPQDLHRYFKSKKQEDFQIATDDTATEECIPKAHSVLNSSGQEPELDRLERPPLRPLIASAINHLEPEVRETLVNSESEAEILWPQHFIINGSPTSDAPLHPASPDVVNARPMPIFDSSSPNRRFHNARRPLDLTMASPQLVRRLERSALQSPPPSSPRPRNRQANLPFRPPTIRLDDSTNTSPYQTIPAMTGLHTNRRERRAFGMHSQTEAGRLGSAVVASPTLQHISTVGSELPFSTLSKNEKPPNQRGLPNKAGGTLKRPFLMHKIPDHSPCDMELDDGNRRDPWQHEIQAPFIMRTPTPKSFTGGGSSWDNHVFVDANRHPNEHGPTKRRRIESATLEDPFSTNDSRSGRSESRDGSLAHLRFARQRMKSCPIEHSLYELACKVKVLYEEMGVLLKHTQSLDCYLTGGELRSAIGFKTLSEITEIDKKLYAAVETWRMQGNLDIDVEYTLFSQAKGKGKA
jgi:DNA mismatch repair protein MutL